MIQPFQVLHLLFSYYLLLFRKFIAFQIFKLYYNHCPWPPHPTYAVVAKKFRPRGINYHYYDH